MEDLLDITIQPNPEIKNSENEMAEGRVVKVLSIDMNYIMYTCIKLYFDSVNPEEYSTITWQALDERRDIDQFLSIDKDAYLKIVKVLKRYAKLAEKVKFVDHQKDIVNNLVLDNDGIMYEITNFDFYHDLFVDPKKDKQKLKHFNKYNDMNWVGYIDAKEKLFSYHWYSNPNSPVLDQSIKFNTERISHHSYHELDGLFEDSVYSIFEEIYISHSPNLVPHKFNAITTDVLKEIFEKRGGMNI